LDKISQNSLLTSFFLTLALENVLNVFRKKGLKVLSDCKLLPSLKSLKLDLCKHSIYGKHNRKKFKTGRHTHEGILDYIHYDVWGPSPTISYGGSSYFVTFIDDFSRKVWIYMLKRKADVFTIFKKFIALVEKSIGRSIKCLRIDNGGEFMSIEFENYCQDFGIDRHKTTSYTPQQNGVVDRHKTTSYTPLRARSMLSNANLQQELWAETISTSCYLVNRSSSIVIVKP
jgi:transposase InsO family protein